jgi:hypothetical protein
MRSKVIGILSKKLTNFSTNCADATCEESYCAMMIGKGSVIDKGRSYHLYAFVIGHKTAIKLVNPNPKLYIKRLIETSIF